MTTKQNQKHHELEKTENEYDSTRHKHEEKSMNKEHQTLMLDCVNANSILFIQFKWRYYRKDLRAPKDNLTFDMLIQLIDNYNKNTKFIEQMNMSLQHKKIRNENIPSVITENIVKFVLYKQTHIMGCWDTQVGDLVFLNKKLEIKGFSSDGPSSFGPTESWDILYFVDCKNISNNICSVYKINLSNSDPIWNAVKVNKTETYSDQCKQKRRPRICFIELQKQLKNNCKLIFSGDIKQLQ